MFLCIWTQTEMFIVVRMDDDSELSPKWGGNQHLRVMCVDVMTSGGVLFKGKHFWEEKTRICESFQWRSSVHLKENKEKYKLIELSIISWTLKNWAYYLQLWVNHRSVAQWSWPWRTPLRRSWRSWATRKTRRRGWAKASCCASATLPALEASPLWQEPDRTSSWSDRWASKIWLTKLTKLFPTI